MNSLVGMYKTELGLHKSADHYRAYVNNSEMCSVYENLIVVVCFSSCCNF